jgi:triphosphatase
MAVPRERDWRRTQRLIVQGGGFGLGMWPRQGNAPEASKGAPIRIDVHASAEEAFKQIVSSTLTHLLSNVGAAGRGDVEGVHQIRVAARRLRATLALFKQHLNPVTVGRLNDELRRLGSLFGAARDWDVFVLETLSAAENGIPRADIARPPAKSCRRRTSGSASRGVHRVV